VQLCLLHLSKQISKENIYKAPQSFMCQWIRGTRFHFHFLSLLSPLWQHRPTSKLQLPERYRRRHVQATMTSPNIETVR